MTPIKAAVPADEAVATSVLTLAFGADPITRWTWADPAQYLAHFPAFAKAFGGRAFMHGGAHLAVDKSGAALWLPPGVGPDEESLAAIDGDGVPAYLESTNPKNVPLYERHGFELLGTIEAATSPPLFPMLRRARRTSEGGILGR